jgi:hypothetical protein
MPSGHAPENLSKKEHPHRDLSTALRSGRDDKGEGGYGPEPRSGEQKLQISPLRFAPVEMTKGRAVVARKGTETAGPSTAALRRDDKFVEHLERALRQLFQPDVAMGNF